MVNKTTSKLTKPQLRLWFFISLLSFLVISPPAFATKLPADLKNAIQAEFPGAKIRLDGSAETTKGEIFIPLIPAKTKNGGKLALQAAFPSRQEPNLLVFGNAWCYLRVLPKGRLKVVKMPTDMPEKFHNFLLTGKLPEDLIVPDHFVLPKSLAPIVGDLAIEIVNDDLYTHPEFGAVKSAKKLPPKPVGPIHGAILALSPNSGKIALLDHESLKKLTEFPTEGTPAGITYANGIVYISDVSKNKILRLDPTRGQFIGQIDLPPNSKPRGMATLPNSKLFYVSESGTNDIAVYEPGDKNGVDKLLVRTKCAVGPSYVAVSPNGQLLLALNTPCGKLTFISALTQKLLNTVNVGTMPNGIVIDSESERAYISNRISNTVSVVDLLNRKVIETLKTGNGPTGLAFDEEETKLFVANAKDNTISVFDLKTNKRLDDIKLPLDLDFPGGITLMPDRKHLLVSSESTPNVGLIDTKTMIVEKQPDIGQTSDRFLFVPSEN